MPRVEIPVTEIDRDGVAPPAQTDADAASDHFIDANDGRIVLEIESSDGADQTVEFEIPSGGVDDQPVTPRTVTIPDGETRWVGPFPRSVYNQPNPDLNKIFINPSVSTTLKFRAYKI